MLVAVELFVHSHNMIICLRCETNTNVWEFLKGEYTHISFQVTNYLVFVEVTFHTKLLPIQITLIARLKCRFFKTHSSYG